MSPMAQQATTPPNRPVLRSPHPTELKPYKQSFYEKTYLPLLGGMMVTAPGQLEAIFDVWTR